MKKKHLFSTAMILVLLTTACASQSSTPGAGAVQSATVQESAAADSTTAAESTSGEAAADSTAAAGSASDKAAAGADQNTSDPAYGTYEDPAGWYVQYEPSLFSVEKEADGARFLYTGEAVGENYVDIRYIPDREPKEVLTEKIDELIEEWELDEEEIVRDEEFIYDDKWCYSATAEFSEEDRDTTVRYQAGEYRDGVILISYKEGMTDENILEGFMDDALWQITDTLTFYNYPPQKEFASVSGVYSLAESDPNAVGQILLKKDHTGTLTFQDSVPVIWGSDRLTLKNEDTTYAYRMEGDSLFLDQDGTWVEYKKTDEPAENENPLSDPAYVEELNREIDALYHDGVDKTGRIHKMQAFILELALHAKEQNPDFQIITQNAAFLAYNDGRFENGDQTFMRDMVDGWAVEGIVGKGESLTPSVFQRMYVDLAKKGKYVSDTTMVQSEEELDNYLTRAAAWGIVPYPKLGGELAKEVLPGQRWADNGDYFWVEDPATLGIGDRIDGKRDVLRLTDAQNFLYNINSRPYDNWQDWDKEEEAFDKGDGDRTRIDDSYACGLLVPSENGSYTPVGEDQEGIDEITAEYGDKWDWWWREAGLDVNAGRETWLEALRNSDYDVIYIDSFYNHKARPGNQTPLTAEEVESLKQKPDGGRRKVIAYLAIGTAEQNRWYCQDDWIWVDPTNKNSAYSMKAGKVVENGMNVRYVPFVDSKSAREAGITEAPPEWLAFDYGDDYPEEAVVEWWHPDWRDIIIRGGGKYADKATGDTTSSIDRVLAQGFDGVYLDNPDSCLDSNWDAFNEYWRLHGGIPE